MINQDLMDKIGNSAKRIGYMDAVMELFDVLRNLDINASTANDIIQHMESKLQEYKKENPS